MSVAVKVILFGVVLLAVLAMLVVLPTISLDKDAVINSSAWHWIAAALYFFPMHTVRLILTIVIDLAVFSLIVAVAKTIWDILPFL